MPKQKNKTQTVINHSTIIKNIDYNLLAEAIVKAQVNAAEKAESIKVKQAEEAVNKWHNSLGIKTINDNWNPLKRGVYSLRNSLVGIWHLLWIKREKTFADKATVALLSTITSKIIGFIKLFLYLFSLSTLIKASSSEMWLDTVGLVLVALALFMIARLLRIVQFEVEKITDFQYLISLLSTLLAMVALLISVFAWIYPR